MSSFFTDLVADLRAKHLWPVALILLIALVAVPLVLAKPGGDGASAPAPAPVGAPAPVNEGPGGFQSIAAVEPIVTEQPQFPNQNKKDRKFVRKNPFAGTAPTGGTAAGTAGVDGATGVPGTGTGDTGTTYPSTPTGDSGSGGGTTYYRWVVTAKFGEEGKKQKTTNLTALRALPDSNNAVLVFLGVRSDGSTAVFLMSSAATTTGDGTCVPSDDECSFLYMKRNDTNTLEAVSSSGEVTTYELKVTGIKLKEVDSPSNTGSAGGGDGGDPTASSKSAPKVAGLSPASKAPTVPARGGKRATTRKQARQQRKLRLKQRARQRQAARVIGTLGF